MNRLLVTYKCLPIYSVAPIQQNTQKDSSVFCPNINNILTQYIYKCPFSHFFNPSIYIKGYNPRLHQHTDAEQCVLVIKIYRRPHGLEVNALHTYTQTHMYRAASRKVTGLCYQKQYSTGAIHGRFP